MVRLVIDLGARGLVATRDTRPEGPTRCTDARSARSLEILDIGSQELLLLPRRALLLRFGCWRLTNWSVGGGCGGDGLEGG